VVLGAGALGQAVARILLAQGKSVRLVSRSGRSPLGTRPHEAAVSGEIEVFLGDLMDPERLREAVSGAAVVFHCAQPPYSTWSERFIPLTDAILEATAEAGAKLILGDNLYMYGPVDGPMTEDLPSLAQGPKGRTRARMAQSLLQAHEAGRVQVAIGRSADFFGPGVTDSYVGRQLFEAALAGKRFGGLMDLDAPHTFTFIDDFARSLVTLSEREEALGKAWHVPSAPTISTRQFVTMVYEQADRTPRFQVAGRSLVAFMGLFNPMMRELKEMLYQFDRPFVMDASHFQQQFGASPTPHDEAIRQTLDWYRNRSGASLSGRVTSGGATASKAR
jgi:nucleoside-diphosphate-sugar epimerase